MEPWAPGEIFAGVIKIQSAEESPEGLITHERGDPAGDGGFGPAEMGIEQPKRNQIADAGDGDVGEEYIIVTEFVKGAEVVNCGKIVVDEFPEVPGEVGEHQGHEKGFYQPAEHVLEEEFWFQLLELKPREQARLMIAIVGIDLAGIDEIEIGDGEGEPPRQNFVEEKPVFVVEDAVIFREQEIRGTSESEREEQAEEFREDSPPGGRAAGPINASGLAAMDFEQENVRKEIHERDATHANECGVDGILHFQRVHEQHRANKSDETGGHDPCAGGGVGEAEFGIACGFGAFHDGSIYFLLRRHGFHFGDDIAEKVKREA